MNCQDNKTREECPDSKCSWLSLSGQTPVCWDLKEYCHLKATAIGQIKEPNEGYCAKAGAVCKWDNDKCLPNK